MLGICSNCTIHLMDIERIFDDLKPEDIPEQNWRLIRRRGIRWVQKAIENDKDVDDYILHGHLLQVDDVLDDYENDQFLIHTHSETKINKGICNKYSKYIPTLHSDRDSENASVGLSNDIKLRAPPKIFAK